MSCHAHGAGPRICQVCYAEALDSLTAERDAAIAERDGYLAAYETALGVHHGLGLDLSAAVAARDEWARQCSMASEHQADTASRLSEAVARAEKAERREPAQEEADACANGASECFVAGWTARRCRVCRRWVFGGPTACVQCVRAEAQLRDAQLAREVAERGAAEATAERNEARKELRHSSNELEWTQATEKVLRRDIDGYVSGCVAWERRAKESEAQLARMRAVVEAARRYMVARDRCAEVGHMPQDERWERCREYDVAEAAFRAALDSAKTVP